VDTWGELEFGSRQGDQSQWFIDMPAFKRLWDSPVPVIAVINRAYAAQLAGQLATPQRLLGEKGNLLLLANHGEATLPATR